jgi:hypothetical protein
VWAFAGRRGRTVLRARGPRARSRARERIGPGFDSVRGIDVRVSSAPLHRNDANDATTRAPRPRFRPVRVSGRRRVPGGSWMQPRPWTGGTRSRRRGLTSRDSPTHSKAAPDFRRTLAPTAPPPRPRPPPRSSHPSPPAPASPPGAADARPSRPSHLPLDGSEKPSRPVARTRRSSHAIAALSAPPTSIGCSRCHPVTCSLCIPQRRSKRECRSGAPHTPRGKQCLRHR